MGVSGLVALSGTPSNEGTAKSFPLTSPPLQNRMPSRATQLSFPNGRGTAGGGGSTPVAKEVTPAAPTRSRLTRPPVPTLLVQDVARRTTRRTTGTLDARNLRGPFSSTPLTGHLQRSLSLSATVDDFERSERVLRRPPGAAVQPSSPNASTSALSDSSSAFVVSMRSRANASCSRPSLTDQLPSPSATTGNPN